MDPEMIARLRQALAATDDGVLNAIVSPADLKAVLDAVDSEAPLTFKGGLDDKGRVAIDFGRLVRSLTLGPNDAAAFAQGLLSLAAKSAERN